MKNPITLRINRLGEFTVAEKARTEVQCGRPGATFYKYMITIEATNNVLTDDGFVMNDAWCDRYFQDTYNPVDGTSKDTCPSCEDMAQAAINYFIELFRTHPTLKAVDLQRIYVKIHGGEFSFIEGEWKKK